MSNLYSKNLNTAEDYYKLHKNKVNLQRIEGVVSPISAHKAKSNSRGRVTDTSVQSAQMQLKPPTIQRCKNLSKQFSSKNYFSTIDDGGLY